MNDLQAEKVDEEVEIGRRKAVVGQKRLVDFSGQEQSGSVGSAAAGCWKTQRTRETHAASGLCRDHPPGSRRSLGLGERGRACTMREGSLKGENVARDVRKRVEVWKEVNHSPLMEGGWSEGGCGGEKTKEDILKKGRSADNELKCSAVFSRKTVRMTGLTGDSCGNRGRLGQRRAQLVDGRQKVEASRLVWSLMCGGGG
jgi:hypothetical protein